MVIGEGKLQDNHVLRYRTRAQVFDWAKLIAFRKNKVNEEY